MLSKENNADLREDAGSTRVDSDPSSAGDTGLYCRRRAIFTGGRERGYGLALPGPKQWLLALG